MPRRAHKSNAHSRKSEVLDAIGGRQPLELDPLIDAWDQQPRESPRNFGLFALYRDHGRLRSVAQIAGMSPISYSTVAKIARFGKWVERAGLWDAEQDRITGIRLQGAREEMAQTHAKAARKLI